MDALDIRQRIRDIWKALGPEERWNLFSELPPEAAREVFVELYLADQIELLNRLDEPARKLALEALPPDDLADLLQALPEIDHSYLLALLDDSARLEVEDLKDFHPEEAGGLMTPRFVSLDAAQTVAQAIVSVRQQAKNEIETISVLYVVDSNQQLLGILPIRQLLAGADGKTVAELMDKNFLFVSPDTDREAVAKVFSDSGFTSLPVVDAKGKLQGIVTFDDVAEVMQDEVTEDIQKMAAVEFVDGPYLRVPLLTMIQKRAGWLSALFIGEMLTATAMSHYEEAISKAVVLAVFIPLIISSGGNSGSQASTLIIRAMALDEVSGKDWLRIFFRELLSGLSLGVILGSIGVLRILVWQHFFGTYGEHYLAVAFTVGISLIGVVLFGSLSGSMLPFILKKIGFDPASASAPFVATLVDVSGLVIYFSVASVILANGLL